MFDGYVCMALTRPRRGIPPCCPISLLLLCSFFISFPLQLHVPLPTNTIDYSDVQLSQVRLLTCFFSTLSLRIRQADTTCTQNKNKNNKKNIDRATHSP